MHRQIKIAFFVTSCVCFEYAASMFFVVVVFLNLSCMQTYHFTSFFLFCFCFCYFLSLLLSFFVTFLIFFSLWFIGLLHRFFLFCVCIFGQTLTIAQFHASVYKYVKYIAQGCCESVMDIFF